MKERGPARPSELHEAVQRGPDFWLQRKSRLPRPRELFEAMRHDPDFWLQGTLQELAHTGNPYFAWMAIQVCIEHGRQFPEWLLAYLGDCAERMLSDKAREGGRDIRKVLPWIFGFPNVFDPSQSKKGPGNLLNPEGDPDMLDFVLNFATRLERGEKLSAAVRNACNTAFSGKLADVDDKTLRSWLRKCLGLKEEPPNADAWLDAAREYYCSIWEGLNEWKKSRELFRDFVAGFVVFGRLLFVS